MSSQRHIRRPWIGAALAALAFSLAWFAPAIARAAFLPACELREQVSLMPTTPREIVESTGDAEAEDGGCDRADFGGLAPMCDARGATVLAPPRIRAVDGATIDGIVMCSSLGDGTAAANAARSSHDVASAESGLAAVIDTAATLGLANGYVLAPAYLPPHGGPLAGIARGIDHPPR